MRLVCRHALLTGQASWAKPLARANASHFDCGKYTLKKKLTENKDPPFVYSPTFGVKYNKKCFFFKVLIPYHY